MNPQPCSCKPSMALAAAFGFLAALVVAAFVAPALHQALVEED